MTCLPLRSPSQDGLQALFWFSWVLVATENIRALGHLYAVGFHPETDQAGFPPTAPVREMGPASIYS